MVFLVNLYRAALDSAFVKVFSLERAQALSVCECVSREWHSFRMSELTRNF